MRSLEGVLGPVEGSAESKLVIAVLGRTAELVGGCVGRHSRLSADGDLGTCCFPLRGILKRVSTTQTPATLLPKCGRCPFGKYILH